MEGSPVGGSGDTSQDQGVVANIGRAFDGVAAGMSDAAFSDRQLDLP